MYRIARAEKLAPAVTLMEIEAPEVARTARAGQFIILRISDTGERIPLTVAGQDPAAGTVTIIFQEMGRTTAGLARMKAGDSVQDFVGPLGHPTPIELFGTVAAIAGGVGTAEILPVARALREKGNTVIGIVGARTKDLLILEKEMTAACNKLYIATDDGSYGHKGLVTNVMEDLIARGTHIDLAYAIGPVPMMRAVSGLTRQHAIRTLVSLNPIMVDGTGMCGACRVTVGGETKFACVDGPEFDGHQVNWDELSARLTLFRAEEKTSLDRHKAACTCGR